MSHPVRFGLKYAPMGTTPERMREVWTAADQAGFDHLWIMDHFMPLVRSATGWYQFEPTDPVFEAWTTLASMAEVAKRIRIGVNVTGNLYRHPSVLAKTVATVDQFSGGRVEFGIGASWAEFEFTSLGIPFPQARERMDRLAEACEVLKLLWTRDVADYDGSHYQLRGAISQPKPVQQPHPPIWIGGSGEKRLLRIAAQHADVWNLVGAVPEEALRLSRVLDAHCDEIGRDPAKIRRSIGVPFRPEDPDRTLRDAEALVQRGFTELLITVKGDDAPRQVDAAAGLLLRKLRG
ncbi:MAG TPA: TIGR03560 family F420-dependent LLM class oxidoreductase [Candidatus Dormibacteraeota bacterium]